MIIIWGKNFQFNCEMTRISKSHLLVLGRKNKIRWNQTASLNNTYKTCNRSDFHKKSTI